jgi:glyoxylase I family protein
LTALLAITLNSLMIHGMHHTSITSPNIERAIAFYVSLLGFKLRAQGSWEQGNEALDSIVGLENSSARFVMLWAGNTHLEIFQYTTPEGRPRNPNRSPSDHGITHICLDVTDVDAEYERLSAAGMRFNTPPRTVFGVRTTYGADPDGNVIELQEVLDWEDLLLPEQVKNVPV